MAVEAVIYQQIVDMNWDQAIYTASPNNTINVAQFAAKGSGTNIGIALTPKGTGYISAQVADNANAGGNVRGANAVDFQMSRSAANQVASGQSSALIASSTSRASGANSACIASSNGVASGSSSLAMAGADCVASGQFSVASGGATASGGYSWAIGLSCVSSNTYSYSQGVASQSTGNAAQAFGRFALAHRQGMRSQSSTSFGSVVGSTQSFEQPIAALTTDAIATEMSINGSTSFIRFNVLAGTVINAIVQVTGVKSDGSAVARYLRQVTIKRVVNTTSLVGSVITLGTDEAAGTSLSITADDTNDSLKIDVTGIAAETWRWSGSVVGTETFIGT